MSSKKKDVSPSKKDEFGDDSEDEAKEAAAAAARDPSYMTAQLQGWLSGGKPDYFKALKFASSKVSRGSKTAMFYSVICAYCLLK